MLQVKRINLKKYVLLAGSSTLFFILISDRSWEFIMVLLGFCLVTFTNQWMLMAALAELLKTPKDVRRMDRLERPVRNRWGLVRLRKFTRCQGSSLARKARDLRRVSKRNLERKTRHLRERRYNFNLRVKRNSLKIVFLVIFKMIILVLGIGLGVHFIADRIIFPVINHVLQIIALALSVKRR